MIDLQEKDSLKYIESGRLRDLTVATRRTPKELFGTLVGITPNSKAKIHVGNDEIDEFSKKYQIPYVPVDLSNPKSVTTSVDTFKRIASSAILAADERRKNKKESLEGGTTRRKESLLGIHAKYKKGIEKDIEIVNKYI